MSVRNWRCPNCSASMTLRAEEGLFRCPYCDTTQTVGDVMELVRRARRKADEAAARQAPEAASDAQPPAPSAAPERTTDRVFRAAGTAVRWAVGFISVSWLMLFLLVLLFSGSTFNGTETAVLVLFMVPPAVVLYLLWRRGKKK